MKAAALSSPLTGAAPGLGPGALLAVLMDSAGSFAWESALSGASVSWEDGRVATMPGLDGTTSPGGRGGQ